MLKTGAVFAYAFDDSPAGHSARFQRTDRMRGIVEGEKIVSEMDHDVEYRTLAPEVENAFVVREHSLLQEAFDEKFDLAHDGIVVLSAEAAAPSVVAVVVDEPVFVAVFFQDAELVEYDDSEILFQRE